MEIYMGTLILLCAGLFAFVWRLDVRDRRRHSELLERLMRETRP